MPPLQGSFDAMQYQPKQVGETHPVGKFPFKIAHTEITETKDKTGGMLVVTFRTPVGELPFRYNLWNASPKAVEIAHGQLSALCYATGIFKVDWSNEGAALRNGEGMIEVGYQKGQEPSAENPQGGYTEVKRVYDRNGNEPGKAAPQPHPQQVQPNAWPQKPQEQPQAQPQAQPQGNGGGWPQSPPQAQPQAEKPAWSQGPSGQQAPWKS